MEIERKRKENGVNGYSQGYNYPAAYYNMSGYEKPKVELKGSFWVPCREKGSRNSFCDGE